MIRKLLGLDWLARKLGYVEQDVRIMRRDMVEMAMDAERMHRRIAVLEAAREPRPEPLRVPLGCYVCGAPDHNGLACPDTEVRS